MSAAVEVALIRHGRPNCVEGVAKPDTWLTDHGFEHVRSVAGAMVHQPVRAIAGSEMRLDNPHRQRSRRSLWKLRT